MVEDDHTPLSLFSAIRGRKKKKIGFLYLSHLCDKVEGKKIIK
ncbi:hypothetical protein ABN254_21300 [Providencia rettgeri]